jgi:hypothetical protein
MDATLRLQRHLYAPRRDFPFSWKSLRKHFHSLR